MAGRIARCFWGPDAEGLRVCDEALLVFPVDAALPPGNYDAEVALFGRNLGAFVSQKLSRVTPA